MLNNDNYLHIPYANYYTSAYLIYKVYHLQTAYHDEPKTEFAIKPQTIFAINAILCIEIHISNNKAILCLSKCCSKEFYCRKESCFKEG